MRVTNENLDCAIVSFYIHNVCNYSCSYCASHHYDGSHRWPTTWKPYTDFLTEVRKRNKYVFIEIFGGEPTLWPQFQDFIDTVSDDNTFIEISTNASRTLKYWEKFKSNRCFMMLSWHHEFADDDHFFEVANILQHKASVHVPLMVVPENFERAKRLYERFEKSNFKIDCQPKFTRLSIGGSEYFPYTTEQREWINSVGFYRRKPWSIDWKFPHHLLYDNKLVYWSDIAKHDLHKFKGWTCNAGVNRFFVEPDGNIQRCSKNVGGSLGNIFKEYKLPENPIVCTVGSCPCKVDAIVEKWQDDIKIDKNIKNFFNNTYDTIDEYKFLTK